VVHLIRRSLLALSLAAFCAASLAPALGDPPKEAAPAPPKDVAPAPPLRALQPTFFVLTDSADPISGSMMTIGTTTEIRKAVKPLLGAGPWILPQPDWKRDDLVRQCLADPLALGGVVVTFYTGAASHFYLLYQSETQTFVVTAELIACNRSDDKASATPTVVGVIGELPGAHGTPWVVRRTQVSIPLISFAGVASLLLPKSPTTTSKSGTTTSDVTSAAIVASLVSQASTRDIPGYSTPLKLRYGSQEVGVDLIRAMRDLCTSHADLAPGADATPRDRLCNAFGFTLDPAKVAAQQEALDKFEAAERNGAAP